MERERKGRMKHKLGNYSCSVHDYARSERGNPWHEDNKHLSCTLPATSTNALRFDFVDDKTIINTFCIDAFVFFKNSCANGWQQVDLRDGNYRQLISHQRETCTTLHCVLGIMMHRHLLHAPLSPLPSRRTKPMNCSRCLETNHK